MTDPEGKSLAPIWPDEIQTMVAPVANAFALVPSPDGICVTVGQAPPPVFVGTPEEQRTQLDALQGVPVSPLARFYLTPQRAVELGNFLLTAAAQSMIQPAIPAAPQ